MALNISIFGIIIIAVFSFVVVGLLVLLWYPLRRWRFTWVPFAAVGSVVLAAPWAEEYWIASRFDELCKDAGVHVYRKVEVEGFLDMTSPESPHEVRTGAYNLPEAIRQFDRNGYLYREFLLTDGRARRLERTQDGLWQSLLDRPAARYHYKYAYQPTPHRIEELVAHKLEKTEDQVVDSETGEVLGRDTRYSRYPAAVEALWMAQLFGSGRTTCHGPLDQPEKHKRLGAIYTYVLLPKESK